MRHIELETAQQVERTGHTSKGDQPKWQIGEFWYKADHMGYESLSEIVASRLLARSSISNFVLYEPVLIQTEVKTLPGCSSLNFRERTQTLVPLERLHRAFQGEGLAQTVGHWESTEDRIRYTVDFVERVTGLNGFGRYLSTIMELDAFLLNEDRHTNNLAVIRDEESGEFQLCPIFDNGLSLLSDLNDYPIDADLYACIQNVKAKPFSSDFADQTEAASTLYGSDLHVHCTANDVPVLLQGLDELYGPEVLHRAERVLREQMRKYSYLFVL